jgi:hypothetical protein
MPPLMPTATNLPPLASASKPARPVASTLTVQPIHHLYLPPEHYHTTEID